MLLSVNLAFCVCVFHWGHIIVTLHYTYLLIDAPANPDQSRLKMIFFIAVLKTA